MANPVKLFSRSMAVALLKQKGITTHQCVHTSIQIEADEIPRLVVTYSVSTEELAKAMLSDEAKDTQATD